MTPTNNEEEDEVDPLDAFMADIEQEAIADLKQTYEKTQLAKNSLITPDPQLQVDEFQDYDDPNEDFMEEVQKRALQNIHGNPFCLISR